MATPEVQSASPPRKRRWYQFSLRTLMIVMLLASIGMSWFAVKMQQARRQRAAVEAIEKVGGRVMYEYEDGEVLSLEPPGPKCLREISGVDFFVKPVYVVLGPNADDASLKELATIPSLKGLNLSLAQITDDGLSHLTGLSQLTGLEFYGNKITDDGLAYVAQMSRLEYLDLSFLSITDAGLDHLKKLHQLRRLYLDGTKITAEGIAELQRALPDCDIYWGENGLPPN